MNSRIIEKIKILNSKTLLGLLLISIFIGTSVSYNNSRLVVIGFVLLLLFSLLFFYYKTYVFLLYGVFLLFQDLLIINLTPIQNILKYMDDFLLLLMLFLVILSRISQQKKIHFEKILIIPLLISIIGLLGNTLNHSLTFVAILGLYFFIKPFLFFYLAYSLSFTEKELLILLRAFLFVALIIMGLGIINFFFPSQFYSFFNNNIYTYQRSGLLSVQSIFIHPGWFSWFTTYIGLFLIGYFLIYKNNKLGFVGVIFITSSILALRRKSIVGGIVALFFTIITSIKSLSLKIKIITISICIIFLILILAGDNLLNIYHTTLNELINISNYYENPRIALYYVAIKIGIAEFPLGVGFGRYASTASVIWYSPVYYEYGLNNVFGLGVNESIYGTFLTDTYWPSILGETGVLGLILYSIFLIIILSKMNQSVKNEKTLFLKFFSLAVSMILIQSFIETLASPLFSTSLGGFFVFGAMGIWKSLLYNEKGR